ncbi:hypothetical protein PC129_g15635 [Phytophthora cactorum]|uniref:Uncharacterized protein n=1 Tax=Phytophthora cactorum TaxID=29920 RepID=A0A329RLM6_9STRA|nr:hypothetical protein Pcac1_g7346 [Phytophthora cactorum]KAG2810021.1 hypothetical protein PC111_g15818 [Phytophthora cactorum]KAG2813322.1 hypothetical protein PC112_g14783 [Phytophthora cactorum]KAG2852516.1 hypothetical protein PC113_g14956 [Phytophthora cactorum]KAG2895337.1 hypothetical protein PC114_g15514 [Phytophthora cactorum]
MAIETSLFLTSQYVGAPSGDANGVLEGCREASAALFAVIVITTVSGSGRTGMYSRHKDLQMRCTGI